MGDKVNVSASGGAVSIGNLVQGDRNQASATVSSTIVDQGFERASAAIRSLGEELRRPAGELASVIRQLEDLKAEARAAKPATEKGAGILKTVRENFSWAYPLVKDFAGVAWPALLAAISAL